MPAEQLSLPMVIAGLIQWGAVAGSVALWTLVVARVVRGQPIVPYEPRRPLPRRNTDGVMVLLVLAILILIATNIYASFQEKPPPVPTAEEFVNYFFFESLVVALVCGGYMAASGATLRDLGFPASKLGKDVVLGGAAYLAAVVPITLIQLLLERVHPYQHQLIESYETHPGAVMMTVTAVGGILVSPLAEELIFRVLLQGWLESLAAAWRPTPPDSPRPTEAISADATVVEPIERLADDNPYQSPLAAVAIAPAASPAASFRPPWWPILVSATLFALLHWGQGLAPIPLFFFAVILGYVYQRTHRLWPSLVAHALLNAGSLVILWLSVANLPKG